MQDINQRLDAIEERLFALEKRLGIKPLSARTPTVPDRATAAPAAPLETHRVPATGVSAKGVPTTGVPTTGVPTTGVPTTGVPTTGVPATRLMAWCAGITFVLAAVYFLKLVHDTGWLTPIRQVSLAYCSALILVGGSFYLEKKDRHYAAYLPAVALVVLYLTTFMAHLYYHLLMPGTATGIVGVVTLAGIWLGRRFNQSVYVIFSAVGVYLSPLLVHAPHSKLMDLVVYYSAWSLLFSFCAIQEKRRITYLLPMFLSILGFDLVWRMTSPAGMMDAEWVLAASYQLLQFMIFAVTTVLYAIVHREPMDEELLLPHGLALFIFYAIEYALLQQHVPEWVNYFAGASGAGVYGLYVLASRGYPGEENLRHSGILVSYYCSWVAFHAVFLGEIDHRWLPWAVLCTPFAFLFIASQLEKNLPALVPVALACGTLFLLGYTMLLGNILLEVHLHTPQPTLALFVYLLLLYGMYFHLSRRAQPPVPAILLLYAGHLAWIACLVDWVDEDIYLSALWALYGVALLLLAVSIRDKVIGQSALLIFSAAALKVLLFDLSATNSLLRVLVLLVLSGSLYTGGWLYQSLLSASLPSSSGWRGLPGRATKKALPDKPV